MTNLLPNFFKNTYIWVQWDNPIQFNESAVFHLMTMNKLHTRFLALDAFRGLTVCFMIIVNTQGDKTTRFAQVTHADWHGFTPADWVFPSFLFAVGNALAFVMPKFLNQTPSFFLKKVAKRSAIIFLLGFLMYWFPFMKWDETGHLTLKPLSETRILGVLQRIAIAYFVGSLLVYFLDKKRLYIVVSALLLAYWAILLFFGQPGDPLSIEGNAVYQLDHFLLGDNHMYKVRGIPFDPEGLLSTLPAVVNVVAGYLVGQYILTKGKTYEGLAQLLVVGFSLVLISEAWHWVLPMNKRLWTSSFTLYTIGLDCCILALIMYAVDFKNWVSWTSFFTVFGKNALFIYLFSELFAITLKFSRVTCEQSYFKWLYQTFFQSIGGNVGSLLFSIVFMLICWAVGWWLDKKKIYVKV